MLHAEILMFGGWIPLFAAEKWAFLLLLWLLESLHFRRPKNPRDTSRSNENIRQGFVWWCAPRGPSSTGAISSSNVNAATGPVIEFSYPPHLCHSDIWVLNSGLKKIIIPQVEHGTDSETSYKHHIRAWKPPDTTLHRYGQVTDVYPADHQQRHNGHQEAHLGDPGPPIPIVLPQDTAPQSQYGKLRFDGGSIMVPRIFSVSV